MIQLKRRRRGFNTQPPEGGCLQYCDKARLANVCFNTQPPEGGCKGFTTDLVSVDSFNTQPPEGGCNILISDLDIQLRFQHTAARRRLLAPHFMVRGINCCFNTQPPEGGCNGDDNIVYFRAGFNTQPPEGGCGIYSLQAPHYPCFNTQPPEGGCKKIGIARVEFLVSTHSRPKAAAFERLGIGYVEIVSTHSRPKAAATSNTRQSTSCQFQHTAARRRLRVSFDFLTCYRVFQHTAARRRLLRTTTPSMSMSRFNTQPPEGGCSLHKKVRKIS